LAYRLSQHQADILHRVVVVDSQVSLRLHLQVEKTVPRPQLQHVVEEGNAGRNLRPAGAVEIQPQADARFARRAFDHRDSAVRHASRWWKRVSIWAGVPMLMRSAAAVKGSPGKYRTRTRLASSDS